VTSVLPVLGIRGPALTYPRRMGERRWLALDGLRGVAVLMVVVGHVLLPAAPLAIAGVSVFFVLSGFLITQVILTARARGEWSLGRFLAARAVRLVPALLVMQVVVIAWWLLSGGAWSEIAWHAIAATFYVENIFHGQFSGPHLFSHTWSLAVEEQFYLVWPLLVGFVIRSRRPLLLLGAAIVASMVVRLWLAMSSHWIVDYVSSASLPANAFALLVGCLLAIDPPAIRSGRAQRVVPIVGLVAILGVAVAFTSNPPLSVVMLPIVVALIGPVVVAFALLGVPLLEAAWLRFVGRISYALYLWHFPVFGLLGQHYGGLGALPAVALSFGLAVASTLWLEEPLRRRWRARSRTLTPAAVRGMTKAPG
jgi:peptidoglycan/LPS O-acetylase OafA/YrhL